MGILIQVINMRNMPLYMVAIYIVNVLALKFIIIINIPQLRCSGHLSSSYLLMLPCMCPSQVRDKNF